MTTEKEWEKLYKATLDRNKNLKNFAHIVSHNLRSHATNITMLIDFLRKEKDKNELTKIEQMLKSASNGLNETLGYLNELVQIEADATTKMKPLSLQKAVLKIQNDLSALIEQSGATVNATVKEDHRVLAVPAYLDSILLNLFTNALKYASPKRKPILSITSRPVDDMIELKFEDNGLGIDLEQHGDKIFGMYKTFHRHEDAKGIGLFMTKNQIEAMGGQITVASEIDGGTIFTLKFKRVLNP